MLVTDCPGAGVGLKTKLGALQKHVLLHGPVRRNQELLRVFAIAPFDNAAYLHVRKGEGFGQILESVPFDNGLVEWLAGEWSYGAVGSDRAGFHVNDVKIRAPVAQFH